MTTDLTKFAKDNGIEYFMISFTDLFGGQRAKLVPARAIADMQEDGAGFAGFATWLDLTPAHPDMLAVPDPEAAIILPWDKTIAWVPGNCVMEGQDVAQAPRNVLRKLISEAADEGMHVKTGIEAEFFLLTPNGEQISDQYDTAAKPCYDQQALMRQYPAIKQICDSMIELGWGPYQNDHEDANGQFEMNWDFDDALTTADRQVFFKFMVKSIAEIHGMRATFMPKPFTHLSGKGCHSHLSIWSLDGTKNLFNGDNDKRGLGLSSLAYQFLGGIMHSADRLTAIFNPTVNSYKRINAPRTLSGATWSPSSITYGGNNRTHMIRVPDSGRFELRLMDGAANAYLMQAAILACGLDGIAANRDPGDPLDINMYELGKDIEGYKQLPKNLLDALRLLEGSDVLRERLGDNLIDAYIKLKHSQWNDYSAHLSQWERDNTLDC